MLSLSGLDFIVRAAKVDERVLPGEIADKYVRRMAEKKAIAVLELLDPSDTQQTCIIAADTAVVNRTPPQSTSALDRMTSNRKDAAQDEILGKPNGSLEAWAMLRRLRGRTHQVYTGLTILRRADKKMISDVHITDVLMRDYSEEELQIYIESGDPLDKAGAYAIQHTGFQPVETVNGCYANVMGLPLCSLMGMLAQFGMQSETDLVAACQDALSHPCGVFEQYMRWG